MSKVGILQDVVPSSLMADVVCFTFYDNHPADTRKMDITVCTKYGELFEVFRKLVIRSVLLEKSFKADDIESYRNVCGELYYLIAGRNQFTVISSSSDKLVTLKSYSNVDKYCVEDIHCSGSSVIRLWFEDDVLPVTLNSAFELVDMQYEEQPEENVDDSLMTSLKVKLKEAVYNLAYSEKKYEELVALRHAFVHAVSQKSYTQIDNQVDTSQKKVLYLEDKKPWIRTFHRQLIFGFNIRNCSESEEITDIQLILCKKSRLAIHYKTFVLKETRNAPKWKIQQLNVLKPSEKAVLIATMQIEEFTEADIVDFIGVVIYKCDDELKFIDVDSSSLSCMDIADETYQVLSNLQDENKAVLSILTSMNETTLKLTFLDKSDIDLPSCFEEYLDFKELGSYPRTLLHHKSPYHPLYGAMVVVESKADSLYLITTFTRDINQLLFLICCMYTSFPHRMVITTADVNVKLKSTTGGQSNIIHTQDISQELMEIEEEIELDERSVKLGENICDQISMALKYLDSCIVEMGKSKDLDMVNKIGKEIVLSASGAENYKEFVESLRSEMQTDRELLS